MHYPRWSVGCLIFLCFFGFGCGGTTSSGPNPSTTDPATESPSRFGGATPGRIVPTDPEGRPLRKELLDPSDPIPANEIHEEGLVGKWLVSILMLGTEVSQPWLMEITESDGSFEVKITDSTVRAKAQIRDLKKEVEKISFQLVVEDQSWPFEGTMVDGRVQGSLELRDRVMLAWLERTRMRTLRGAPVAVPALGVAEFEIAQRSGDPKQQATQMRRFAEQHSDSPLSFDALRTVLKLAKVAELSGEDVRAVIEKYQALCKPWGQRWCDNTVENIAYDLATAEGPVAPAVDAVALEFAEAAKAALGDEVRGTRRQSMDLAMALSLVNNDRKEEGKKLLDELLAQAPNEGELVYYSAMVAEKLGELDRSIDLLVSLWPHLLASRELDRVWKNKHGSGDGLEDRIDGAYLKKYPPITVEPFAGRKDTDNNQVILLELFTGTSCPPCVAADLAFEALGRAFNRSDLVLLQYHLHVPGPDPLTNADSEARAEFYKVPGTPIIFVNGQESGQPGGPRQKGAERYVEYRAIIEKELEQKSPVKVELTVNRDGDEIRVDAKLNDVAEPGEMLRLRLALVEEKVRFTGLNGVRLHHYVVRSMPGGSDGVPITEATINHRTTVNVAELRKSLAESLDDIEKKISTENNMTFGFPSKPLDLSQLGVVVFVQDDSSKKVLHSTFVPLDAAAKAATESAAPAGEKKPAEPSD